MYRLKLYPWDDCVLKLTAIKIPVISLNLGLNGLGRKDSTELTQAFAAIPMSVAELDLRSNGLCRKNGAELAQAFSALTTNILSLNLRWNNLGKKRGTELAQAFSAIPLSVTILDLCGNNLYKRNGSELTVAFSAISANVTSIDLSFNKLYKLSVNQLILMKDSLQHVQTVRLDYNSVNLMSTEQRAALKNVFPNVKQIILVDNFGKEVAPTIKTTNMVGELGGKTEVPSLLNQCAFFASRIGINLAGANISSDLKEQTQEFLKTTVG